ncbi:hypothetical protein NEA10_13730 [Phormidium yuhuli AB48]|uniref:Uncharacterized protein n=1 Tax=Phormidium yuhuli AB48 TaxID=2940671 RepID=A0ABY5AL28_9CYAN|nr:hypothetical protein [Phormidium yuhuli]USR89914.1 hypothetical protein NEA10_13730 [Phormidium yuhuli AB48]
MSEVTERTNPGKNGLLRQPAPSGSSRRSSPSSSTSPLGVSGFISAIAKILKH